MEFDDFYGHWNKNTIKIASSTRSTGRRGGRLSLFKCRFVVIGTVGPFSRAFNISFYSRQFPLEENEQLWGNKNLGYLNSDIIFFCYTVGTAAAAVLRQSRGTIQSRTERRRISTDVAESN